VSDVVNKDQDLFWSQKRVAVTGATGFIGAALVESLVSKAAHVASVTRTPPGNSAARWINVSQDSEFPLNDFEGFSPQVVIHLATKFQASHQQSDIKDLIHSNIEFGTYLLNATQQLDATFVNISSSWQHYQGATYSPVSLYAATKQAFLDIARYYAEVGVDVRDLSIYDTFGPTDKRDKIVRLLLKAARSGAPIEMGDGKQLINLLYIRDAVNAILLTAQLPRSNDPLFHEYAVRANESISIRDLVDAVQRVTGKNVDAQWGLRDPRPREMLTEWVFGDPLPGWSQEFTLDQGLEQCWQDLAIDA